MLTEISEIVSELKWSAMVNPAKFNKKIYNNKTDIAVTIRNKTLAVLSLQANIKKSKKTSPNLPTRPTCLRSRLADSIHYTVLIPAKGGI